MTNLSLCAMLVPAAVTSGSVAPVLGQSEPQEILYHCSFPQRTNLESPENPRGLNKDEAEVL